MRRKERENDALTISKSGEAHLDRLPMETNSPSHERTFDLALSYIASL